MANPNKQEIAPDPDEDDLDDLDDVLDEFATTKLDTKPTPSSSGPGRPESSTAPPIPSTAPAPEDEFAKQLQAGMADLLGEMDSNPEMQRQFEEMIKQIEGAAAEAMNEVPGEAGGTEPSSSKPADEESFQDAIKRTMERIQSSGASASVEAAASSTDDILAQMLAEMEKGGFDPAGGGSDEDFSKMLLGMMEQLTNKEILYEPMKELDEKFPVWMEKNESTVSAEERERYQTQQTLVREIVARFERAGYSDGNTEDREYIVERMQKMQAAGSPPPDLVGDMNAAQEAMGDLDAGCPQQ
ncbi:Pex19-domain-containing protein [Patellaria atrata CBS 101060]|uniref:Pex19-domain-containing protein n=1 Tax=Patellaria atrata CBS 101060 TaxID=1346257 RepID=A0A9P4SFR5_9PEZI|nr:Pex19-domain-containing protein [Patellaria atrata CBS 101060]